MSMLACHSVLCRPLEMDLLWDMETLPTSADYIQMIGKDYSILGCDVNRLFFWSFPWVKTPGRQTSPSASRSFQFSGNKRGKDSGCSRMQVQAQVRSKWVQHGSVWIFYGSGFGIFVGFLSWYHLPCICNSFKLESVILHGICYILAWSLCILHGICYIWPCSPPILHGICHVSALQPLICMVFARFWYFKRSCGFLESFFTVSCRVSFQVSFRVSLEFRLGFLLGFI